MSNKAIRNGNSAEIRKTESEISGSLRWATNGCHLFTVFLFGGIIFGWAPLKLVLVREGQYSERCAPTDSSGNNTCAEQMRCFNAIFTVGQFLLNFVSLPVGTILDTTSKPFFFMVGGLIQVTGFILFAISESDHHDYFILSYGLMALGGSTAIIGALPASFLVPVRYQPLVLAASSCLFDASSIIFYLVDRLNLSSPILFTRTRAFLGLAVLAFFVYTALVVCWILLENRDWKAACDWESNEHESATDDDDTDAEDSYDHNNKKISIASLHSKRIHEQRLHEKNIYEQLASFEFAFIVIFSSIHVMQCNLNIETINEYLASIGDKNGTYADIFSFVLPVGIVFIPIIDATIQKIGAVNTLMLTNVLSIAFGSILLVPNLTIQMINFGLFTCMRAFLFSTINTYTAETFGVSTMGRVIGCNYLACSIITLLQYPAASIAEGYFNDKFWVVNLSMLVFCLVPVLVTVWYCRVILLKGDFHQKDKYRDSSGSVEEQLSLIEG